MSLRFALKLMFMPTAQFDFKAQDDLFSIFIWNRCRRIWGRLVL